MRIFSMLCVISNAANKFIFQRVIAPNIEEDRKWDSIKSIRCRLRSSIYRQLSRRLNMNLLVAFGISLSSALFPCTTIIVTKGASTDGSVFVTHSDDDELQDPRIIYVPAQDHEPGSQRGVYEDDNIGSFRYVGKERGPGYDDPSLEPTQPVGYIDQVPHTYAYFDGNYGMMNEHQLMIGECTDAAAKIQLAASPDRLFYSSELSRVALERCKTAREAVQLIGQLIDTYGVYGTGETLLLGDKEEGWVFEMCNGTMDDKKGLWVAKKVPDGEVFVAANEFRIREVDPKDPDMMYSKNLFDEVQKRGWWKPKDGPLDWVKAVSYGEYNHPYYCLRRVWSVMRRLKPSANFSPWVKDGYTKEYPFSVKPDKKLNVRDVMALHRDYYQGTEFDLSQGLAAGPFGCPYRYTGDYDGHQNNATSDQKMWGAWERPVSVFYCGYIHVNQARSWLPNAIGGICWYGCDQPFTTCFVPFYVGMNSLPQSFQICNTSQYDESAWRVFNFVSNWAALKFSYMKKDIMAKQDEIENNEVAALAEIDAKALSLYQGNPANAAQYLTDVCTKNAESVVTQWRDLSKTLIVKYSDGYVNIPKLGQEVGYPEEWLKKVGYQNGPISYKKPRK